MFVTYLLHKCVVSNNTFSSLMVNCLLEDTVDREYFAGSKVASAKYSMSFNFINLACVRNYFTPEILIHGVFPLRTCGK